MSNRNQQNKSKKHKQRPSKGLLDIGVEVSISTIRKKRLETMRKATRARKNKFHLRKRAFGDGPVAGVAKWSRYRIMVGMPRVQAQCHKRPAV
ncbi:hypothetical protein TNCV_4193501 [Trichonephila clavipes]|nr:hypothetical protein TNCV_4193501 [Trichonephila clavipes]